MRLLALGLMIGTATTAWAETSAPDAFERVAVYSTNNGSVPPPYHWEWSAAMFADGTVEVTFCKGYDDVAPYCAVETGKLSGVDQLRAIQEAARDSGLLTRPAVEANPPMIGGGRPSGVVYVNQQKAVLISQPRASDKRRVESVLALLAAAVPADLVSKAEARAVAPPEN